LNARVLARLSSFLEALHHHEKQWREHDRKARGGDHTAEHGDANSASRMLLWEGETLYADG
jgi:hypothetical protein